jgi:hypothetical protein
MTTLNPVVDPTSPSAKTNDNALISPAVRAPSSSSRASLTSLPDRQLAPGYIPALDRPLSSPGRSGRCAGVTSPKTRAADSCGDASFGGGLLIGRLRVFRTQERGKRRENGKRQVVVLGAGSDSMVWGCMVS